MFRYIYLKIRKQEHMLFADKAHCIFPASFTLSKLCSRLVYFFLGLM